MANLASASLLSLPLETRLEIYRYNFRNACVLMMRNYERSGDFGFYPRSQLINTGVLRSLSYYLPNKQWDAEYCTEEFLGFPPVFKSRYDDNEKYQRESQRRREDSQRAMSRRYDQVEPDVRNVDFAHLRLVSNFLAQEAYAALLQQGYDLQFYGYGVPDLVSFDSQGPGRRLRNVKRLTLSPTVYHDLDYKPALQCLPNLELIYLDSMYVCFDTLPELFSAVPLLAGISMGKPAAHERLRTLAKTFMPATYTMPTDTADLIPTKYPNEEWAPLTFAGPGIENTWKSERVPLTFAGPGIQNALIVRQIYFQNLQDVSQITDEASGETRTVANILNVVFAKRIFESEPGGLPWVVRCTSNSLGKIHNCLTIDQAAAYLHTDITDTDALLHPEIVNGNALYQTALSKSYRVVAPVPGWAEWDVPEFDFDGAFKFIRYLMPNVGQN